MPNRHGEGGAEGGRDDDRTAAEPVGQAAEEWGDDKGAESVDRFEYANPDRQVALVADVLQHHERKHRQDDSHPDDGEHRQHDEHDPSALGVATRDGGST